MLAAITRTVARPLASAGEEQQVRDPHWHIGGVTLSRGRLYLDRAHILSPRVSIEEFIRLMIEDLGVEPRTDDWDSRLRKTHKAFAEHKTW